MFSTSCPDLSKVMVGEFRYGTVRVRGAYVTPDDAYLIVNTDIFEGLLHNGTAIYEQEQDYGVIKGLYGKRIIEEYLAEQEEKRRKQVKEKKIATMADNRIKLAEKTQRRYREVLKYLLMGYAVSDISEIMNITSPTIYAAMRSYTVEGIKELFTAEFSNQSVITAEDVEQFISLDCNYKKYRKYLGDRCASLGTNGVAPVIEDLPAEMIEELIPETLSNIEETASNWDSWDTVEETTENSNWNSWDSEATPEDKQICIDYLNAVAGEDENYVDTGYTEETAEDDPWGEEDFDTVVEYEHDEEAGLGVSEVTESPKEIVDNDIEIKNYVSCRDKEVEPEETTELPEYLQKATEPEVPESSYYSDNFSMVNGKLMPKLQPKGRN